MHQTIVSTTRHLSLMPKAILLGSIQQFQRSFTLHFLTNEQYVFNNVPSPDRQFAGFHGFLLFQGKVYRFTYMSYIDLVNAGARKLLTYLQDGNFLNNATSTMEVIPATYNGECTPTHKPRTPIIKYVE